MKLYIMKNHDQEQDISRERRYLQILTVILYKVKEKETNPASNNWLPFHPSIIANVALNINEYIT